MLAKIGEVIFLILSFIASLFHMASPATDYSSHSLEERIEFISENQSTLEQIVDYALEMTDQNKALDSVLIEEVEKKGKMSLFRIKRPLKERISVYRSDIDTCVDFNFRMGTEGHSDSGMYYSQNGLYIIPASGTPVEYDEKQDKYIHDFPAYTQEVVKVNDHWFLYHKDFKNNQKTE